MPEFEEGCGNGLAPEYGVLTVYGVVPVYGVMPEYVTVPEYGTVPKYVEEGYGPEDGERTVGNRGGNGKVTEYA